MHNLEMINGQASMVYNSRYGNPWHDLGTAVDGAMTSLETLNLSKQNWKVIKVQTAARNPVLVDKATGRGQMEILGTCALYRSDNGARLADAVGEDYEPIDNHVQFEVIDYLLQAHPNGGAYYDTAGVLGRGERVWVLARLAASDFEVAGDKHETFLLACTSHDMSLSFTLKLTVTRVVCRNTLSAALSSNGAVAKIRHTKSALERVERAKRYMETVKDNTRTLADKLRLLSTRKMTRESMTTIMDKLFPIAKDEEGKPKESTRRENIMADVMKLYEVNDGNANPEIRGTAYNLLNAVTEYTDHLRSGRVSEDKADAGYTPEKARIESALFGSGDALKSKALETILLDTAGNPVYSPKVFTPPTIHGTTDAADLGLL